MKAPECRCDLLVACLVEGRPSQCYQGLTCGLLIDRRLNIVFCKWYECMKMICVSLCVCVCVCMRAVIMFMLASSCLILFGIQCVLGLKSCVFISRISYFACQVTVETDRDLYTAAIINENKSRLGCWIPGSNWTGNASRLQARQKSLLTLFSL